MSQLFSYSFRRSLVLALYYVQFQVFRFFVNIIFIYSFIRQAV
jgi:hypothetical protein